MGVKWPQMAESRSREGADSTAELCFLYLNVTCILMLLSDLEKTVLLHYISSSEITWISECLFCEEVEMVLIFKALTLEGN